MRSRTEPGTPPPVAARLAVAGVSAAVLALGGLAVWSAFVTQHEADQLTRVGVQTTGQLRAVQALFVVRVQTDALEDDFTDQRLATLREAQRSLPDAIARMAAGDAPEAVRVARQAEPLVRRLDPAIERFLTDPRGDILYHGEDGDDTAEDEMELVIAGLEDLLNDSESDPAELLGGKLATVTDAGLTVRRTALVLVPVGLAFVVACGWLLRQYRRRSEAAMQAILAATAREARTDQLTGLPNRRALLEELDRRVVAGESFSIALADLNGFKHYNDTFGHPAGDALLRRLGARLAEAWQGSGFAARLGGDEFCVLTAQPSPNDLQERLRGALTEQGEGFTIDCVVGVATVPAEAADASAALGLADTRLYAAKAALHGQARRPGARAGRALGPPLEDSQFTLARMLEDRYPGLGQRLDRVARLSVSCAELLGLSADQIVSIERAAQLHDIGKVALPAAILAKRGALTDEEQQFMRRHTVIGERLLNGIDDLEPVAAIVRATHERWDGAGYPDQLAGDRIPVGARIIAVADAYCAMTSVRPHAPVRNVAEALAELHRCSGSQFDPAVVAAVADAVTSGRGPDQPSTAAPIAMPA